MATDPRVDIRIEVNATRFFLGMLDTFIGWRVRLSHQIDGPATVGVLVRVERGPDGRDPLLVLDVDGEEQSYRWSDLVRVKPMEAIA